VDLCAKVMAVLQAPQVKVHLEAWQEKLNGLVEDSSNPVLLHLGFPRL